MNALRLPPDTPILYEEGLWELCTDKAYEMMRHKKQFLDDDVTFYFLKNDTLTNCQLEDIGFYPDMGVEFTIQDTSEVMEEVDV